MVKVTLQQARNGLARALADYRNGHVATQIPRWAIDAMRRRSPKVRRLPAGHPDLVAWEAEAAAKVVQAMHEVRDILALCLR